MGEELIYTHVTHLLNGLTAHRDLEHGVAVKYSRFYSNVHLSFLLLDLSFARPLDFDESSVFRDRISRIRSKNT